MLCFIGKGEHFLPFGVDDVILEGEPQQLGVETFNCTEDIPLAAVASRFLTEK